MNDEWVIENLRVTLFSAKHKERVIIQNNRDDLRVTTRESEESIRQDVGSKVAADKAATTDRKAKKDEAAADKKAKKDEATATRAAASPAASSTPTAEAPSSSTQTTPRPSAAPESASRSLKWRPTEDAGYTGFSAESRDGKFVVLKTERSLWALYFSWGPGAHVGLGCFWELKDARVAAQKQHDEGPVPRPSGTITADMIDKACPAPPTSSTRRRRTTLVSDEQAAQFVLDYAAQKLPGLQSETELMQPWGFRITLFRRENDTRERIVTIEVQDRDTMDVLWDTQVDDELRDKILTAIDHALDLAYVPPQPEPVTPTTAPSAGAPRPPPKRTRSRKSAAQPEPAEAPEPPQPEPAKVPDSPKPEPQAPQTDDIEIDPEEAKKMLGQLKGLLDQED